VFFSSFTPLQVPGPGLEIQHVILPVLSIVVLLRFCFLKMKNVEDGD